AGGIGGPQRPRAPGVIRLQPVAGEPQVALHLAGDAVARLESLGNLEHRRLADVALDLVEERRQLAFDPGFADPRRAVIGQRVELDRRRQHRLVARDDGDEVGRLLVGRNAWVVAVDHAELEPRAAYRREI